MLAQRQDRESSVKIRIRSRLQLLGEDVQDVTDVVAATGWSKVHTEESIETWRGEVQKSAYRKLSAPFQKGVSRLIRHFGAGGVSVAIGELAPGPSCGTGQSAEKICRP